MYFIVDGKRPPHNSIINNNSELYDYCPVALLLLNVISSIHIRRSLS